MGEFVAVGSMSAAVNMRDASASARAVCAVMCADREGANEHARGALVVRAHHSSSQAPLTVKAKMRSRFFVTPRACLLKLPRGTGSSFPLRATTREAPRYKVVGFVCGWFRRNKGFTKGAGVAALFSGVINEGGGGASPREKTTSWRSRGTTVTPEERVSTRTSRGSSPSRGARRRLACTTTKRRSRRFVTSSRGSSRRRVEARCKARYSCVRVSARAFTRRFATS